MADDLKLPAGAVPPPAAGSKVQPKKETVRISLPPKTAAKETVRLELPPRSAAAAAPAPAAPAAPRPAAPAVAAPAGAKQTVRLELPPKPGAKAPAVAGEVKLLVPQVTAMAASVSIPDAAEMATMDSSQASPLPAAVKPGGLKGGPPGSRLPGGVVASPGQVGAPPASEQPDATPSAVAVPAIKALPKQAMTSAPISVPPGGVVVRAAGWPDYLLAGLALVTGIAAVVHLLMLIGGGK
jgi:translation initiation factor IF-2